MRNILTLNIVFIYGIKIHQFRTEVHKPNWKLLICFPNTEVTTCFYVQKIGICSISCSKGSMHHNTSCISLGNGCGFLIFIRQTSSRIWFCTIKHNYSNHYVMISGLFNYNIFLLVLNALIAAHVQSCPINYNFGVNWKWIVCTIAQAIQINIGLQIGSYVQ
jgi:hypothetical protein